MHTLADIAHELEQLRRLLLRLPPKGQPSGFTYPFVGFIVDDDYVELTGSIQGSVNHSLEVAFGSRANADNSPLEFKSHGPDLVAVVDVLSDAITGTDGENPILLKWVVDLQDAANHAFNQPLAAKRARKPTEKRVLIDTEAEAKADNKKQRTEAKIQAEDARMRTEGNFNFDPENLRPIPYPTRKAGRKTNPLLDQLTIYCEVISDPSVKRWRCFGSGCPHSWGEPRASDRVFPHAMHCTFLPPDLVRAASSASASKSLGSQLEALTLSPGKSNKSGKSAGSQPSVHKLVHEEGIRQRSMQHNHHALTAICVHSLPPTIVDSPYWQRMIFQLDPKIEIKSASHVSHALIPAEAARVREKSVQYFKTKTHLTVTVDGSTNRRVQSIYTLHVTCPDTRQAHLMAGDEASGKSHTGEHILEVLLKVIDDIGAKNFSAVTTDSAGNTRLARELLGEKYPWIIVLGDVCHHMNNTAKDITSLPTFTEANSQMRLVIRYFRKSSYAAHHLTAWRTIVSVSKGLVAIGKTRFLSIYYAIDALLPCLPGVVELAKSGVIKLKKGDKLAWLKEKQAVRTFEDLLRQEKALLEPLARSVKCLESSASTLADVPTYWLASMATWDDIFTDPYKRDELMLSEETISDVHAIVNGRFAEMIDGPDRQMYFAALFLDFRYIGSKVFTRRNINPLSTTIHLPAPPNSAAGPSDNNTHRITHETPDSDLRASLPAYERTGRYLASALVHEINSDRAPEVFSHYDNVQAIFTEFRFQFMNYTRQYAPFDRYINASSPLDYWQKLMRHVDAQILAYLAVKMFSVVPNSMAEERTVSSFTKLNSPERGRQKASTIVDMTQIKQYEQRLMNDKHTSLPTAPVVRFRDLSNHLKVSGMATPVDDESTEEETAVETEEVDPWEVEAGFDEEIECPPTGSKSAFDVSETEYVNLKEPLLLDLLSDEPVEGAITHEARAKAANLAPNENSASKEPLTASKFEF